MNCIEARIVQQYETKRIKLFWPEQLLHLGSSNDVLSTLRSMEKDGLLAARIDVYSGETYHHCWSSEEVRFKALASLKCEECETYFTREELDESGTLYFVVTDAFVSRLRRSGTSHRRSLPRSRATSGTSCSKDPRRS